MILLAEITHAQDAALCAEKMLLALSAPYRIDQHNLHLTASIGIVTYPNDGTDAETLLRHADFAMYHAKKHGAKQLSVLRVRYDPARARAAVARGAACGTRSRDGSWSCITSRSSICVPARSSAPRL